MNDRKILVLGIAATALVLATGALWMQMSRGQGHERFTQCGAGAVAGGADSLGGAFTLTDGRGERLTDERVFSKPSILYFGYTYCPDVCPLDVARNAEVVELLGEDNRDVQPVFITVDPRRDTPEVVERFVSNIHPDMIGLTGTQEEVDAVSRLWRNYYQIRDDGTDNYLVDHLANSYLVLPDDGTVAFFRRDLPPEDMAQQVACLLDVA
ncbi:MAG: SCO family protein [Paracoccus sp. (in: a-proteobacteria)]|nr:SCO family protein [Paracoccus sp. (in: a-proteobacteria)]